jgi:TetR/AcrR family transcriptional repressor of nem operon
MDTKCALLDSAEQLARAKGFDAFSYADLSKVVGIRKASIHHHFPCKADLALGLIKRYAAVTSAALDQIRTERQTGGDQLIDFLALYRAGLCDGTQVCLCVAFSAGRDSFDETVLIELNRFHDVSIDWLTALFERGRSDGTIADVTDPRTEALACLSLVEGAQLMARAARNPEIYDQATAGQRIRANRA